VLVAILERSVSNSDPLVALPSEEALPVHNQLEDLMLRCGLQIDRRREVALGDQVQRAGPSGLGVDIEFPGQPLEPGPLRGERLGRVRIEEVDDRL